MLCQFCCSRFSICKSCETLASRAAHCCSQGRAPHPGPDSDAHVRALYKYRAELDADAVCGWLVNTLQTSDLDLLMHPPAPTEPSTVYKDPPTQSTYQRVHIPFFVNSLRWGMARIQVLPIVMEPQHCDSSHLCPVHAENQSLWCHVATSRAVGCCARQRVMPLSVAAPWMELDAIAQACRATLFVVVAGPR